MDLLEFWLLLVFLACVLRLTTTKLRFKERLIKKSLLVNRPMPEFDYVNSESCFYQ